jgi:hypothetical protein
MKFVFTAARILLALIWIVFGLNGFLRFIPIPPLADPAQIFMNSLLATGYMMPFWKTTEIICGLAFLTNRWVPLAAVVSAPITLNILAFHVFLDPGGLVIGIVVTVLNVIVAWEHRGVWMPLVRSRI